MRVMTAITVVIVTTFMINTIVIIVVIIAAVILADSAEYVYVLRHARLVPLFRSALLTPAVHKVLHPTHSCPIHTHMYIQISIPKYTRNKNSNYNSSDNNNTKSGTSNNDDNNNNSDNYNNDDDDNDHNNNDSKNNDSKNLMGTVAETTQ